MRTLQELTGRESGIVIYDTGDGAPEAVVCNWSSVEGFPRVDPCGFTVLGFGEDIPATRGERRDDIPKMMEGVQIVFAHGEDMPKAGTVYRVADEITVIAPDGWE